MGTIGLLVTLVLRLRGLNGLYGYSYNSALGVREIDEYQAAVVRRIYKRYSETQSFSMVSGELNEAKIPSKGGGRWYPLTARRVLSTESYTGRTFFSAKLP